MAHAREHVTATAHATEHEHPTESEHTSRNPAREPVTPKVNDRVYPRRDCSGAGFGVHGRGLGSKFTCAVAVACSVTVARDRRFRAPERRFDPAYTAAGRELAGTGPYDSRKRRITWAMART